MTADSEKALGTVKEALGDRVGEEITAGALLIRGGTHGRGTFALLRAFVGRLFDPAQRRDFSKTYLAAVTPTRLLLYGARAGLDGGYSVTKEIGEWPREKVSVGTKKRKVTSTRQSGATDALTTQDWSIVSVTIRTPDGRTFPLEIGAAEGGAEMAENLKRVTEARRV